MAARAAGIIACVDGVFNAFKDDDGPDAMNANRAAPWAWDGKTLIHPGTDRGLANEIFAPIARADVELSTRQIAAYEAAIAQGEAVAVVDGKIVENLHIETARGILAKAAAIRERKRRMTLLILGLLLWTVAHVFKRVAPERRAAMTERMGDGSKGVFALLILGSVVLMTLGYRSADGAFWWGRSAATVGINNLLMLLSVYLFAASGSKTWITSKVKNPQLTAFKIWCVRICW